MIEGTQNCRQPAGKARARRANPGRDLQGGQRAREKDAATRWQAHGLSGTSMGGPGEGR